MSTMRGFTWLAVALTIGAAAACSQQSAPMAGTTSSSVAPETTTTTTTTSTAALAGYQDTSVRVDATRGSNTIAVTLPQVSGGAAAVSDRFNSGMRAALDDLAGPLSDTTIDDGELRGEERSRVTTLGPHVVGGVAIFNTYAKGAAHPSNNVATIVIDADTAAPVLLKDLWTDPQAAAERLTTVVPQVDADAAPLTPATLDTFVNWVPTPEGFRTYVSVAHALGDYLPVTVPWDQISDLLTPQMKTALVG